MRHRHKGTILGRTHSPRKALLQHLAESFIYHETLHTTHARVKAVQPFVEHLITIGKKPTLANRRLLLSILPKPNAVAKLLEVISVRFANRPGGYTRCIRGARRQGDGGETSTLLFVESDVKPEAAASISKKSTSNPSSSRLRRAGK